MIAIKDMKGAPSGCDRCELFPVCKHRDIYNENYKPDDCSLIEIITCKDCDNRCTGGLCTKHNITVTKDFYCRDGERRKNNEKTL